MRNDDWESVEWIDKCLEGTWSVNVNALKPSMDCDLFHIWVGYQGVVERKILTYISGLTTFRIDAVEESLT